jgi:hypothetical protein
MEHESCLGLKSVAAPRCDPQMLELFVVTLRADSRPAGQSFSFNQTDNGTRSRLDVSDGISSLNG